ncbi:unnamed protein product [Dovyalis caffra]|uniref:Uncharacterized protein n=1 Tax=Dovyalis caffra TaxID=77055 RepID=A0AAV1S277_9ROSI|nr:unnamed protein product [Dovyalis caffra]
MEKQVVRMKTAAACLGGKSGETAAIMRGKESLKRTERQMRKRRQRGSYSVKGGKEEDKVNEPGQLGVQD